MTVLLARHLCCTKTDSYLLVKFCTLTVTGLTKLEHCEAGTPIKISLGYCIVNPHAAEATFVQSKIMQNLSKPSKPCHDGIHWIALAEYSQMSTHLSGF